MNLKALWKHNSRIAAFTLMEGLFGVAVMGIVFLSLYTGMASGFNSIRDAQENLRATQIMVEKFESLRLYNWEQITTDGFVPLTFAAKYSPTSNAGIIYTGAIRILPVMSAAAYSSELRAVTITLNWTSRGIPHVRTLTSYVARYGIQNYIY